MKTLEITKDDWYLYIPTQGLYIDKTVKLTDEEYDYVKEAFNTMTTVQELLKKKIMEDDLASGC